MPVKKHSFIVPKLIFLKVVMKLFLWNKYFFHLLYENENKINAVICLQFI